MEALQHLAQGFALALAPVNLLFAFLGALLGTMVGVLPGLGPAATISLLLPLTYTIGSPLTSIIMLAGIYYGAMYGGSTTSILLNIPGEAASVVTCIDGYQLARRGKAGKALGIAALGSFAAGTAGVVGLSFTASPLARFALKFGPPEYFALALLGLVLAAYLSGGSVVKGLIMVVAGLALGCVGIDPISGKFRFSYGVLQLQDGFDFVTIAMGLFGLSEIFVNLETALKTELVTTRVTGLWPGLRDWAEARWAVARGTAVGFLVGLLPGGGALVGSLISYAVEKRISRTPERFGRGAIEGVAGPESANNAAASASFIPLLTLGIPGNASIAMIFAALMIQGVQPGPFLISENPEIFWGVIASMYVGNAMLLVLNLPLVGLWVQLLRVPYAFLAPLVVMVCSIGVFSIKNDPTEIVIMAGFGMLGYVLRKLAFEPGPLLLAFILGPMVEKALRQSLLLSGGEFDIFVRRPIAGVLIGLIMALLIGQVAVQLLQRMRPASRR
ncbi:MAG: tripartite tricarboxylate transporter permease [Desulfobacterales bacterium]|jgi:putative tricarboxylic transport membrane protein|nr:tripartite tricarboxylate transporter permease [Desulfobacterales bacterium]